MNFILSNAFLSNTPFLSTLDPPHLEPMLHLKQAHNDVQGIIRLLAVPALRYLVRNTRVSRHIHSLTTPPPARANVAFVAGL